MKKLIYALLFLCLPIVSISQTASELAKNAARSHAFSSGLNVDGLLNYTDEIRKEIGGNWSYVALADSDTVLLATAPGKNLVSAQTLYSIDITIKVVTTDDTTSGAIIIALDSTGIAIELDSAFSPLIQLKGYYARAGSNYFYFLHQTIINTDTNESITTLRNGNITRTPNQALKIKFWSTELDEVQSYAVFSRISLLRL